MAAAALLMVAGPPAGASEGTLRSSLTTNGVWPGVGKICEPGPGGASIERGVSNKAIHIAAFNDASNTAEPGLDKEFVQLANAFADWCNASGGINGRQIVVDNRDGALFNAGQVTSQACQSDFMAVGGGLVLDQSAVPIREQCGLGQITGFTVSDAADTASDQVNPNNISLNHIPAGWFLALAKKYPQAVKKAAMGAQNNPSILEPEHKWADAAQQLGWNVTEFQEPPLSVSDWTPYVQQLQSEGAQAVWPADSSNIAPYLQAMSTLGFHPSFIALSSQDYNSDTVKALQGIHTPPVYVETSWWPLEMASQNASTEQLVQVMHRYAKGDTIDFTDEEGAESWLLWAKSATACGANLTSTCVLSGAAAQKNWNAGGIQAPVSQLTPSNKNPLPSPCFAMLRATSSKFSYDKAVTSPTQSIWNCNPKNVVTLTPKQLAAING
ncbi:MAG TPA: ABC transporter substrate-binding protein [Acidimicrobiales bacterium]|nr:ABC transporter substrate-binding protein [Acidimicrobiales bacterium]